LKYKGKRKSKDREAVVVRDSKSRYGVFGVVLLVLSFPLAAHGETDGPGNGREQTLTVARAGLSATPADGTTFAGWGGDCTGTTCKLVTDGAKAVAATFRESTDAPASALGDSPTLTGTITNLGRADFAGKTLELKAEGFSASPRTTFSPRARLPTTARSRSGSQARPR
jgi:hypothetical protein